MSPRTYDEVAPHYDTAMGWLERRFLTGLRAEALKLLPPDSRILEVGAGTGRNFEYYPLGSVGVASEPSWEMLKIAAGKTRPHGVSLVQSEAERIPFETASFDSAFATLVFSVKSQQLTFAEMRRVVRPGGVVVLLEHVRPPGLLGPVFDLLSLFTTAIFDDHFNRRTAEEARDAGLQVEHVEKRLGGIINLIACRV